MNPSVETIFGWHTLEGPQPITVDRRFSCPPEVAGRGGADYLTLHRPVQECLLAQMSRWRQVSGSMTRAESR